MKGFSTFFSFFLIALFSVFSFSCSKENSKSYKIGIDPSFYPMGLDVLEKNVYGFTQELLLEMAQTSNIKFFVLKANWDNLFEKMQNKNCEAVFSIKYPYSFEKDNFNFSNIILPIGPALVEKSSSHASLDRLAGKAVGYIRGDDDVFLLEKYPEIIIKEYDSASELLDGVASGFLEGAIIDIIEAKKYASNLYANKLKVSAPLTDEGLRLISSKENKEVVEVFNKSLEKLKKKGVIERLQKKWNL